MIDFILQFGLITKEIAELLNYKFVPDSPGQKSVVGKGLHYILELHNKGEYNQRDIELARANMFLKHLKEVKESRPDLFKFFKNEIKGVLANDRFFGIRFELNIAASLIRKGISFNKQETPDFVLSEEMNNIGIECSSVRTRKFEKRPDLNYKVSAQLREKKKRKYSTQNTLLFLDATNIAHQLTKNSIQLDFPLLKEEIKKSNQEGFFDAVLVFYYVFNSISNGLESTYLRVDSEWITNSSKKFLDNYYPISKHQTLNPRFPWEG